MAQYLETGIETVDKAQAVLAAMLTLPDEQWTILYHRYFNRLTLAETARIIDRSLDMTRKLEARALRNLRQPRVYRVLQEYL